MTEQSPSVVMFSSWKFVLACAAIAVVILVAGQPLPVWILAAEIFATIIGLFVFGSFKYQIHKNALTYGMTMVIAATFFTSWWPRVSARYAQQGGGALADIASRYLFSWHGLDELIHADTMLFILGLTLFVSVIAQTRLLEAVTFFLLRRNRGAILPTVIAVTAVVAVASGILDGVSMIGLTIRTLVIILLLASAPVASIRYAVMVCTVVTTVCGMYLAYGEPPNLIMKSNLTAATGETLLTNAFFLRYCLPGAIASYLIIAWNLRKTFHGERIDLEKLDVLDAHSASVRFLQATRHGEVMTPIELIEEHEAELGARADMVQELIRHGAPLGIALVKADVPEPMRRKLLGEFLSEDLAESLDRHYVLDAAGDHSGALKAEQQVDEAIAQLSPRKSRAQKFGAAGLFVFVVLLVGHSMDHRIPLFAASFAGFFIALLGIVGIPKMRKLALHEARVEYAEYYFLFPLFLSITLLMKAGFFDALKTILDHGITSMGPTPVALIQFSGCTLLSAILDNNVVADFASRALLHLEVGLLHLFALAQIAGYAVGGCWTHIGSAQSVVAFSFIKRDVDEHYTPVQWIREMTPIILQTCVALAAIIWGESLLLNVWAE